MKDSEILEDLRHIKIKLHQLEQKVTYIKSIVHVLLAGVILIMGIK